jgi:hypothetical protein
LGGDTGCDGVVACEDYTVGEDKGASGEFEEEAECGQGIREDDASFLRRQMGVTAGTCGAFDVAVGGSSSMSIVPPVPD